MRSVPSTRRKRCSMSAVLSTAGTCSCVTASVVYSRAISPASPSSVAEKNSVWRSRRALRDDAVDRRAEAHVEHAVGLVEDEDLDVAERQVAAADQVLEPAGGGDDDVGAARLTGLLLDPDAAVDRAHLEGAGVGDRVAGLDDLGGELTRRGEDQGRGATVGRLDAVGDRHHEGERLAGSRRGLGEHVAAGEHVADDLRSGSRTARRSRAWPGRRTRLWTRRGRRKRFVTLGNS